MLTLRILFILFLPLQIFFQDQTPERKVMRRHSNGREHVVLYFNPENHEMLKEEVFFSNGKIQWSGGYKNNLEDGTWQYYYESGKIKTIENYNNGKEHGTCSQFDELGKKTSDSYWKHGRMIKEIKF